MNEKMIEVLKTTDEYLTKLENAILNIIGKIESGNEMEGIKDIALVADGIGWVLDAVNSTKPVQKQEIEFEDINEFISEIIESVENEDYVLTGDLLNYEILPILQRIHSNIKEIIE